MASTRVAQPHKSHLEQISQSNHPIGKIAELDQTMRGMIEEAAANLISVIGKMRS